MSETFLWFMGGTTTNLSDHSICKVIGYSGTGMAPLHRLEERGPLQNGVTDQGYRLDPRVIMFKLIIKGTTENDFHAKCTSLIDLFKPSNTAGKLKFIKGSITRQIDGFTVGGLEFPENGRGYLLQSTSLAIKCPDPRWYDPTINSVNFNISGGADTFVIPFEVPFKLGASTIDTTKPIVYAGNVKSYPTIRIEGPITDPVITNVETGHKLDFTGITIPAGTTYIIDLGYADNTVVTDTGVNKIADLTTDSDLVEFCIDPDYGGGTNNINVTGSSVSAETNIRIIYYDYYIGV